MRRQRAVLLATLVVLAGCNTAIEGKTSREALTPAPTVTAAPGQDGQFVAYDGISADGDLDRERLLANHLNALSETSFTLVWSRWRSDSTDESRRLIFSRRVAVENASTYRYRPSGEQVRAQVEKYADPSGRYGRWLLPEGPSVTGRLDAGREHAYRRFADVVSFTVLTVLGDPSDVRIVERDGQSYLRVVAREPPNSLTETYPTSIGNYTTTIYLHPDGYIRSLSYRYDFATADGPVVVEQRFHYSDVGQTTVTEPAWVYSLKQSETPTDAPATPGNETTSDPDTECGR